MFVLQDVPVHSNTEEGRSGLVSQSRHLIILAVGTSDTHFELPEQPRKTRHVYVVTALDRLQNESGIVKKKVKY